MILDAATSALDTEAEAQVHEAHSRLVQERTVLAIAHRLSTVRDASEILVMEDGRIVERGAHGVLMANSGPYSRLVARQICD